MGFILRIYLFFSLFVFIYLFIFASFFNYYLYKQFMKRACQQMRPLHDTDLNNIW